MLAVILSLAACLSWGISDFLGGLKSRELPVITVLLVSTLFGLGFILILILVRGEAPYYHPNLLMALVGGAIVIVGLGLLYRGLAIGSMAIVAPISGTGVILPVLVGLATGDMLTRFQVLGIAAAIAGSALASREKDTRQRSRRLVAGSGLAVGSAVAFGVYFIAMDLASEVDPFWAVLLMKLSSFGLLLLVFSIQRPSLKVGRVHLPTIIVLGVADSLAGFFYALATTKGMLSVVSVIGSLYPAAIVILAALFLRERPQNMQIVGVILAIAGIALISTG